MLKWKNKQDGVDDVLAEDINNIANELIASQISIDRLKFSKQNKLTAGENITIDENNIISATGGGGTGGGTTDYEELDNKPKINGVELVGNKTTNDLGIKIPTKLSELTNDKGYIDNSALTDYYTKTEVDDIINELPSGGSENWELINKITTTEDTKLIEFTTDLIGNAFELKRIAYSAALKGTSANSSNGTLYVGLSKTTHELDIQNVLRPSDTNANGYAEIVGASADTSKNLNLIIGGTSEGKTIATNGGIANSNVISYIRLYSASSNAIGAGTTVYIYGVKK